MKKINSCQSRKLNVLIIGLGKAGSRFDEENRNVVWSHVGAYLEDKESFNIVNGIDPLEENRFYFNNRIKKNIAVSTLQEISSKEIDIVSIATPFQYRLEIFQDIFSLGIKPKVIICEKPLAVTKEERDQIVLICQSNKSELLVHYNRRFINTYQEIYQMLLRKELGKVFSITVKSPNRALSIGSHAIDLLLYLSNESPSNWEVLNIPSLRESGENAFDFIGYFPSGFTGRILTQCNSKILIFEVEIICEMGRIKTFNNGDETIIEKYEFSKEFQNYKFPKLFKKIRNRQNSSFLAIVENAKDIIFKKSNNISNGITATSSEELLDKIQEKISI